MTGAMPPVYSVGVIGTQWLNNEAFVLSCCRPAGFTFQPGQYVALTLPGNEERDYTLVSSPTDAELRFLIKRVAGGSVSGALAELEPGAMLGMGRAKGYLTYRPSERPVVFVATGVGVAPFVAMAEAGITGFTMIQGARDTSGLFFRRELSAAATRYIPCLSGANSLAVDLPDLYRGYVTGYVEQAFGPGLFDFYLCGSRAMITAMVLLLDRICPEARIFSEAYS